MFEALLWEPLEGNKVRCNLCNFRCVIPEGRSGICKVRINKNGKLYTLLNSYVSSWALDPIEKKPVFHYYPGSLVLSFGTWGCNFRCRGCQNYEISRIKDPNFDFSLISEEIPPEEAVRLAVRYNAKGIAWTYNEPTIWFEYTYKSAQLAKKNGLYTVYVTNGSITKEGLDLIGPYLDVFRVDIKAFSQETYNKITPIFDFHKILESVIYAKERWNMHIEIVTNIIPTINDNIDELRNLVVFIRDNLGKKTPLHITRFFPYLDLAYLYPTPIETLEKIREMAISEGLDFVYIGNVPGHPYEDTYCPKCKRRVIRRSGFEIIENHTHDGKCDFCGEDLGIIE